MTRTKWSYRSHTSAPHVDDLTNEHVHTLWVLSYRDGTHLTVIRLPDGRLDYVTYVIDFQGSLNRPLKNRF